MKEILARMTPVFREILENPTLVLTPELTANGVANWDSLAHVHILLGLEKEFGFQFDVMQVGDLKNVGELALLIQKEIKEVAA